MIHFKTPILFIVFNRPDTAALVLEKIRQVKPKDLFIAADGPRIDKNGEAEKCNEVRALIDKGIDWDCTVHKLYKEENVGCGLAVSGAITWFFNNVEQGIILEDDTVPDISFFNYCETLLDYYKKDDIVMHVSGNNYAPERKSDETYFFTRLPFIWGWATWKRAWQKYDFDNKYLSPRQKNDIIQKAFTNKKIINYWSNALKNFHLSPASFTWDFQWFLSIWNNQGLVVQPAKNLVKNIGFGEEATHTVDSHHYLASVNAKKIENIVYRKSFRINNKLQAINFSRFFINKQKETHRFNLRQVLRINLKIKFRLFKSIAGTVDKLLRIYVLYTAKPLISKGNGEIANSYLSAKAKLYSPYRLSNSFVDDYSYIAHNSNISKTKIGKFCSIGPNFLCGRGVHPIHALSTSPMFYSTMRQNGTTLSATNKIEEILPITIGNDVFIGMNVTVLDGISIGDGAVIGAGAIVSKDIPPYAVAVGNPIRVIKYRFNDEIIQKLLKIKWWEFGDERLSEIEKYFNDVEGFVEKNYD
jgi:acetyltransferase-like isoleucine patch superfamily enzyme